MAEPLRLALARYRREHGLRADEHGGRLWLAQLGGLIVPLPNFRWRREIIAVHDAHHLITGYPPSLEGELHVAAWELGVRCYRDWRAQLLCLGLTAIGLAVDPRGTLAAYRAGRRRRDSYADLESDGGLLDRTVDAFQPADRRASP